MFFEYAKYRANKKALVPILILGAYRPPETTLLRLEKLRDCLKERGFNNVFLVKDYPDDPVYNQDENIHFTRKSQHLIRNWAEIILFVYFDADNSGVTSELQFTISSAPEKLRRSVILLQEDAPISSLVKGSIKIQKLDSETFFDDEDLCEQAEGYCTQFFDQILWKL